MDIVERFIGYTKIDTTSHEESEGVPSTPNQFVLAQKLVEELKDLGVMDARMADNSFVYGTVEANTDKITDVVGFLAHMDTSEATSGENIKARVIKNYDGLDIKLSEGIYTKIEDYPYLSALKGKDIIVTDGTTLLGGDDKAGIAIIMDMVQQLKNHPEIKHGKILIAFTPDEEIGRGIHEIDINEFKPDYAYTVDGGNIDDVTYENFNAASAVLHFFGNSIHPGSAKNKMINAVQLAMDFHSQLPVNERPEFTEGRDGFNHLLGLEGNCQEAKSAYIIRNHDKEILNRQKHQFELITMHMNEMYGKQVVELDLRDSYSNMAECFEGKMYIVDMMKDVLKEMGYNATSTPIRGGTDGAALSYMGIPTPNLGTGGYNCHGNHELVCIDEMKEMVQAIIKLITKIEEKGE